jgi:hypothetical protein
MLATAFSERALQRGVHAVIADPARIWTCSNGDRIQIVAAGLLNVHEGPDFLDAAVLHNGHVHVGDIEFHAVESDWDRHHHGSDPRYASTLIHIVLFREPVGRGLQREAARWTLVLDEREVVSATRRTYRRSTPTAVAVEELQHFALLRLLRQTAEADSLRSRLGLKGAVTALTDDYLARLLRKRRRPRSDADLRLIRDRITESALGLFVHRVNEVSADQLLTHLDRCERLPIAVEGRGLRREIMVNAILPILCVEATDKLRIVLLQWYWSARSIHVYGLLHRRFPEQRQDYVWQQQGMLEFLRQHGRRTSTCGEAIRSYGVHRTIRFLTAASARQRSPP